MSFFESCNLLVQIVLLLNELIGFFVDLVRFSMKLTFRNKLINNAIIQEWEHFFQMIIRNFWWNCDQIFLSTKFLAVSLNNVTVRQWMRKVIVLLLIGLWQNLELLWRTLRIVSVWLNILHLGWYLTSGHVGVWDLLRQNLGLWHLFKNI